MSPTLVVPADTIDDQLSGIAPAVAYIAGDVGTSEVTAGLGGNVISRSDVLADIDAAPMLGASRDIYRIALYGAAGLAAVAAVLSILVAGRSRAHTLSVLHKLGLTKGQATTIVLVEVMPPTFVAAAIGVGIGAGVTLASSRARDLAALTTTLGSTTPIVLNITQTTITATAVLGIVLAAVVATIMASHRTTHLGEVLPGGQ